MIYCISSTSKLKKKKDRPTDPLNFQAKRANKPLFFRPYRDWESLFFFVILLHLERREMVSSSKTKIESLNLIKNWQSYRKFLAKIWCCNKCLTAIMHHLAFKILCLKWQVAIYLFCLKAFCYFKTFAWNILISSGNNWVFIKRGSFWDKWPQPHVMVWGQDWKGLKQYFAGFDQ